MSPTNTVLLMAALCFVPGGVCQGYGDALPTIKRLVIEENHITGSSAVVILHM